MKKSSLLFSVLLAMVAGLRPATAQPVGPRAAEEPAAAMGAGLDPDMVGPWRTYLLPNEAESRYESIDWHLSFADGLRAAAEQNRPLVFWAMNGHPLGCT